MTPLPPQILKFVELLAKLDAPPSSADFQPLGDALAMLLRCDHCTVGDLRALVKHLQNPPEIDNRQRHFQEGWNEGFRAHKSQGWQPISTCPKDKRVLLLWHYRQYAPERLIGSWSKSHGKWVTDDDESGIPIESQEWFTHWHPLPDPPKAAHDPYEFAEPKTMPDLIHQMVTEDKTETEKSEDFDMGYQRARSLCAKTRHGHGSHILSR